MKISYRISREDYVDAQKLHRAKSPRAFVRALVLAGKVLTGIGLLTILVLAAVGRDPRVWSNLAPLVFLLAAWAFVMLLWVPFNWRRSYAKDPRLQQEIAADISEDGIHLESPVFDSKVKWGIFVRFLESDRVFVLYQTNRMFNLFPKAAFAPGEAEEFRNLLRRKLPDK
jgi:hypothetical protein